MISEKNTRYYPRHVYRTKRYGFALIELLLSMLIMVIGGLVAVTLLGRYVALFSADEDLTLARQRASDVFVAMEVPILHAGLGLPTDDLMQSTFSKDLVPAPPFARWGGTSQDSSSIAVFSTDFAMNTQKGLYYNDTTGYLPATATLTNTDELRLAYGFPSGSFFLSSDITEGGRAPTMTPGVFSGRIVLDRPVNFANLSTSGGSLKSNDIAAGILQGQYTSYWITLPGQSLPMLITGYTSSQVNGAFQMNVALPRKPIQNASRDETLRPFSEILHLRAVRYWLQGDWLISQTVTEARSTTGSTQFFNEFKGPMRVLSKGVLRASFVLDAEKRGLSVTLLTRGDSRDSTRVNKTNATLVSKWNLTETEREFHVNESSMYWRLRNVQ